ncbi:MAG: Histidine triad (HIT) protein [Parcubacteria group bacterium GW2011_GWC2_42_6]|nr:MAG: Histidine triad (HIT) protein [Parcubacteria group bacterium GW2011_GWA2_42_11]KKS65851.1 MAG: Histidine triad (HIT) protein [Parcubacteria group bacterium GW2011_GWC2_42_6]KKT76474.1 MAG: Histidine triad (HIT) protein [Parcubacteria group bacterium GW2011_GWF2_44_7]
MADCIFCKIIDKEIPAEILYEDDAVMAFPDIQPVAPVHILIVPKRHIETVNDLSDNDGLLVGRLIITAKKLAEAKGIASSGYKLLFRTGPDGGQEVPHIHLHLIGGAKLSENIKAI